MGEGAAGFGVLRGAPGLRASVALQAAVSDPTAAARDPTKAGSHPRTAARAPTCSLMASTAWASCAHSSVAALAAASAWRMLACRRADSACVLCSAKLVLYRRSSRS